jgi:hypothetical protein
LRDSTAQPCSAYSALLQSSVELNGQATQVFSEKTMRTAAGECFKSVREDLIIVVHGYTLQGSQVMYVPADDSDCQ